MNEVRQRWRLVFRRGEQARFLAHLDAVRLWERAFRRGRIPIATTEGFNPRPRLVFAAPLPLGMLGEHELADLVLSERLSLPELRARLRRDLPLGYELVDLHDDWIGAPSLASQLVASDYRLIVEGASLDGLRLAAAALLGADRLDREKRRETRAVAYDLRPLVLALEIRPRDRAGTGAAEGDAAGAVIWTRLQHRQESGIGRAEEVVAALEEALPGRVDGGVGPRLETIASVRERLWLAGELPLKAPASPPTAAARGPREA